MSKYMQYGLITSIACWIGSSYLKVLPSIIGDYAWLIALLFYVGMMYSNMMSSTGAFEIVNSKNEVLHSKLKTNKYPNARNIIHLVNKSLGGTTSTSAAVLESSTTTSSSM